jgi:hypothetical protein
MRTAVAHIITDRPLLSRFFIVDFPRGLAKSFVGIFGWGTLEMPGWSYRPYLALFALGFVCAAWAAARDLHARRVFVTLALACFAAVAVVVRINLQFTQLQGRYLIPALPAFAVLLGMGLQTLYIAVGTVARPAIISSLLAVGNIYALVGVVIPAYYPPPTRTRLDGTRTVLPTNLVNLALLDDHGRFLVTGPEPHWTAPVEAQAAAFAAFEVDLQAEPVVSPTRVCLRAGKSVDEMKAQQATCVPWSPDGSLQTIRIPLDLTGGWIGTVSHIRLDLFVGSSPPQQPLSTIRPRLVPH